MSDDDTREPDDSDAASRPDDDETEESHLFGIDLGRRGDRAEQASRDEVDPEPVEKVRPAARTLSDRLASAASDRDDADRAKRDDESTE